MPDVPDWSKYLPNSTRFSLQDLGELAARLGSPVTYDRRGEVLWMDQFVAGLSLWQTLAEGTGSAVRVVGASVYAGGFAAELTAGSNGQRAASLYRYAAPASATKWGIEVAFWIKQAFDRLDVLLDRHNGVDLAQSGVRINGVSPGIEYKNSGGSFTQIEALPQQFSPNATYHNLKLVVDMETNEYVRVLLDDAEWDLSGIGFYATVEGPASYIFTQVRLVGNVGDNDVCQIGNVVFTSNEP